MIDLKLIYDVLGPEALQHLQDKYEGAQNSERGARYELTVVAFEILIRALACRPGSSRCGDPTQVHIRQGARIFVDDVVIERPRMERYIQVKHVQDLRWTYRRLETDFRYMRLLSHHYNHVRIASVLVTPYQDTAKEMLASRGTSGVANARVRHLSDDESIPRLERHLHLLSNIIADSAVNAAVVRYVEAAWMLDLNRHATLSTIMLIAHERSRGVVNSLRSPDPEMVLLVRHINSIDRRLWVAADGSTLIVQWVDGPKKFSGKEYRFEWEELSAHFTLTYPSSAEEFWQICMSV